MKKKGIGKKIGLFMVLGLALVGCGNQEKEQAQLKINNFEIVDDYTYDKVKVDIEEEKTAEEIARDYIAEEMGLTIEEKEAYDEFGISDRNGLFIKAAILDGTEMPELPGFDLERAYAAQQQDGSLDSYVATQFETIQEKRQQVVNSYTDDDFLKDVTNTVETRLLEQKRRIQEQEAEKQRQEDEFGGEGLEIVDPDSGNFEE